MQNIYMRSLIRLLPLSAVSLLILSACGSDSTDPLINAQAIDGYIVGGNVFCDDVANGTTQAAGRLTCPNGTELMVVRGGADVGFSEKATTGDILFVGELSAPAHLGYVTPLSTLAVIMASNDEGYDESKWTQTVENLAATLGQSSLDLSADAATVIQLVKLNAQINQLISAYAQTEDDYRLVTVEVAGLMRERASQGAVIDLEAGLANTMAAINGRLIANESQLALSESELDVEVIAVQTANNAIAEGGSPELVAMAATGSSVEQAAVTIDRSAASVSFQSQNGYSVYSTPISLEDFESPVESTGRYNTIVSSSLDGIVYDSRVLQFNKSFSEARVSMAFEIKSLDVGDRRSLSFSSNDVTLSADTNDASSLVLSMPEGSKFRAHGTDRDGSTTTTEILVDDADTFSTVGDKINVTFGQVNTKLQSLGFSDMLASSGNFQMTMVISGLKINERTGSIVEPAQYYTIGTGATRITGAGFQGYITFNR